jgi:hypothetical protein
MYHRDLFNRVFYSDYNWTAWYDSGQKFHDIGVNPLNNNSQWAIGTESKLGGFNILKFFPETGSCGKKASSGPPCQLAHWSDMGGGASRIAVATDDTPWVLTNESTIFRRNGNDWQPVAGKAREIATGADGSVWVVGLAATPSGFNIHKWEPAQSRFVRQVGVEGNIVLVHPTGYPCVVNSSKELWCRR